jgi:DNA-binding CsgD family transcriptional regulator
MSVTLSDSDLRQLEAALHLFLSPLEYERVTEWRRACRKTVEQLIGADRSTFALFCMAGEPLGEQDHDLDSAISAYLAYYHELDLGFRDRRRELSLEVYHRDEIYGSDHTRSEFYNDWIVPYDVDDGLGLGVGTTTGGLPAAFINFYHAAKSHRCFGDRELTLLRLLLPAFKAGIHSCRTLARHRDRWGRVLDDLGYAALVADGRGAVHQTPALQGLLRDEPEADAINRAMLSMVGDLVRLARTSASGITGLASDAPARDVATGRCCYRLRGSYLTTDLHGSVIIVLVSRLGSVLPTDPELRARFGLTVREAEVARLLANGSTNSMVARALGISPHTAERHTERVLAKLGLHSRSAVAALLADARLVSSLPGRMPVRILP